MEPLAGFLLREENELVAILTTTLITSLQIALGLINLQLSNFNLKSVNLQSEICACGL